MSHSRLRSDMLLPYLDVIRQKCSLALDILDFWCSQTMRSRLQPMKKIARTLRTHHQLLLNYFRAKKQFPAAWWRA